MIGWGGEEKKREKLLIVVEAYVDVYENDFKSTILASELPKILKNAKHIRDLATRNHSSSKEYFEH
nr:hypothetical protein [Tenacibaculum maritimum]